MNDRTLIHYPSASDSKRQCMSFEYGVTRLSGDSKRYEVPYRIQRLSLTQTSTEQLDPFLQFAMPDILRKYIFRSHE